MKRQHLLYFHFGKMNSMLNSSSELLFFKNITRETLPGVPKLCCNRETYIEEPRSPVKDQTKLKLNTNLVTLIRGRAVQYGMVYCGEIF